MKKTIIYVILLAIVIFLIIRFGFNPKDDTNLPVQTTNTGENTNIPPRNDASDLRVKTVITYTDNGFTPNKVTVKQGEVVTFENKSSSGFWPASDSHPSHTIYPEFDAKKAIQVGGTYDFVFEKVGVWGFHNHLKASDRGMVTVEEI